MPYSTIVAGTTITSSWANASVRDQTVVPFANATARDAAITVPVVGMVEYLSTNDTGEGLTTRNSAGQWRLPWNLPWGVQGYAAATANQTTITTLVDLSGITVTWTAVANRRYRVYSEVYFLSSVANDIAALAIADGAGSQQQSSFVTCTSTSQPIKCVGSVIQTVAAGSTTRKAQASRAAGTGNITMVAGAAAPAFILVEDIGPSGAPS